MERSEEFSGDSRPFVAVYDGLRRAARSLLRTKGWGERSLGPTGLVNEAIVRLLSAEGARGHADHGYVFAAALTAMRRVLVDRARARKRLKRGGGRGRVPFDLVADALVDRLEEQDVDVEALDAALGRLAEWSPRQAEAVNLRFLLGMKVVEVAERLGCSVSTAESDLHHARAWLHRELGKEAAGLSSSP